MPVNRSHPCAKSLRYWWTGREYRGTRALAELVGGFRIPATSGASADGPGPTPGVRSLRHGAGTVCLENFPASAPTSLARATVAVLYKPSEVNTTDRPLFICRGPDFGLAQNGQAGGDITYIWPSWTAQYSSTGLFHGVGEWNFASVSIRPTSSEVRLFNRTSGWSEWGISGTYNPINIVGGYIGLGYDLYNSRTPGLFSDFLLWDDALGEPEIKNVCGELFSGCPGLLVNPPTHREFESVPPDLSLLGVGRLTRIL